MMTARKERIDGRLFVATTDPPTHDELEEQMSEGSFTAIDGCAGIEIDGSCEHDQPAWPMFLGLA